MDLVLTAFCVITLVVLFFAGCGNTSKEEEILDTLLLVARNVLQFGRLASVMRQYVVYRMEFVYLLILSVGLASRYSHGRSPLTCLLPAGEPILSTSIWKLRIPRRMTWGDLSFEILLSLMQTKNNARGRK